MQKIILPILLIFVTGCASTSCFVEVGVGAWTNADGSPGNTPSEANAYCEAGDFEYGFYHRSDIARGRPFNDQEELSTDALMIKYKVKIK